MQIFFAVCEEISSGGHWSCVAIFFFASCSVCCMQRGGSVCARNHLKALKRPWLWIIHADHRNRPVREKKHLHDVVADCGFLLYIISRYNVCWLTTIAVVEHADELVLSSLVSMAWLTYPVPPIYTHLSPMSLWFRYIMRISSSSCCTWRFQ